MRCDKNCTGVWHLVELELRAYSSFRIVAMRQVSDEIVLMLDPPVTIVVLIEEFKKLFL